MRLGEAQKLIADYPELLSDNKLHLRHDGTRGYLLRVGNVWHGNAKTARESLAYKATYPPQTPGKE